MSFPLRAQKRPVGAEHDLEADDDDFDATALLNDFWPAQLLRIDTLPADFFRDQHKCPELPLARIKKVMKLDEELKGQMISAEAPVLFAKAIEMFIEELTLRAWTYTDGNKRKTLQKTDLAIAIANFDQFDFLIDIVPREEWLKPVPPKKPSHPANSSGAGQNATVTVLNGNQQLMNQIMALVGQQSSQQRPNSTTVQSPTPPAVQLQNGQIVQATPVGQPMQLITGPNGQLQLVQQNPQRVQSQQSSVQQQAPPPAPVGSSQNLANSSPIGQNNADSEPQVFQQVIGTDGSIQHVPLQLQLSPAQLQFLKAQYSNPSTSGTTPNTGMSAKQSTVRQLVQSQPVRRTTASDALNQLQVTTTSAVHAGTTVSQGWANSGQATVSQAPSKLIQITVGQQQQVQKQQTANIGVVGQEVVVQSTTSGQSAYQQAKIISQGTTVRSTGPNVVTVRLAGASKFSTTESNSNNST